jgi:hypothetical protein
MLEKSDYEIKADELKDIDVKIRKKIKYWNSTFFMIL